ncbi:hypothetical protein D3C72_1949340 [compost metagenome]
MSNDISEELRVFIRKYINSVSLLDVLLMLKRDSSRVWTPEEVSAEMRTNPYYAKTQLEELVAAKILVAISGGGYQYLADSAHGEIIDQLEHLYNSRRSTVINYIYSQPIDSIRDFANAFKIKKD